MSRSYGDKHYVPEMYQCFKNHIEFIALMPVMSYENGFKLASHATDMHATLDIFPYDSNVFGGDSQRDKTITPTRPSH